ncbi:hypothetical protein G4B88_005551 [Cannabis sativa]|uniref:Fe2OG dioxygenase domain-containing protein n=1 Tax=Cannabis sativa TaxID=3483 RepID=A0A7J6DPZ2_CANSA|nr:hypothetical protein G4B88_005551 [Cannabis sativa]
MDYSSATTTLFSRPVADLQDHHDHEKDHNNNNNNTTVFDLSFLRDQNNIPANFIWPEGDLPSSSDAEELLKATVVDLKGFFKGDEAETRVAAEFVQEACSSHGFFHVINHGVDPHLIELAQQHMDSFFKLPVSEKLRALTKPGSSSGYSAAHAERFSSTLPWKETLMVYQLYCEAMMKLCLEIMELLAISLGIDRMEYRKFFEDGRSIMRCNYYPPCMQPNLALGTGAHCDPTSLTILHQDQVAGLQVFHNNKWLSVPPLKAALVINIGDTFMSSLHRAVVNKYKERKSMAFFLCPKEDKVVRPPKELLLGEETRLYPNFTWSELLHFVKHFYRSDNATFQNFINRQLPLPTSFD